MKYLVTMNGKYMNSFKQFSEACELKEQLEKTFKQAKIEVISID